MIVVDTMVIAYLVLPGEFTPDAVRVRQTDPTWAAPPLWRSEFRNVLATQLRAATIQGPQALEHYRAAEKIMRGRTLAVRPDDVIGLSSSSGLSAYDCEFVALARHLGVQLVTADRQVLAAFPTIAVSLVQFGT